MSKFLHDNDVKANAIPQVFSKNSQAKNAIYQHCIAFLMIFSKALSIKSLKVGIVW